MRTDVGVRIPRPTYFGQGSPLSLQHSNVKTVGMALSNRPTFYGNNIVINY